MSWFRIAYRRLLTSTDPGGTLRLVPARTCRATMCAARWLLGDVAGSGLNPKLSMKVALAMYAIISLYRSGIFSLEFQIHACTLSCTTAELSKALLGPSR